ncbi:MAG: glucose-1-phosphate thymidylyltransferase [Planctomycetota bacterium]|nr:MAG: glucose-1-phosphate thymidylyltransferase [Planctomycetota bacterium]REJ96834.1 MAG: glucose-1-phosphate thymidylyltransferase [Planctomycetota bacterium]
MNILLFEDKGVALLRPMTLTRPAFTIRCGSFCLAELVARLGRPTAYVVQPHLAQVAACDFPDDELDEAPLLLLNARLLPASWTLVELSRLIVAGTPGVLHHGPVLAAALVDSARAGEFLGLGYAELNRQLAALELPALGGELTLLTYPHDLIRHHAEIFAENLELRIGEGPYEQAADGVFLAAGATLGPQVVTDTSAGPIVLEEEAHVGAFAYLKGPLHLGRGARVNEHASIKNHVALGHTTKVGGEVSESIIEPYSNKQHLGFLGHSYLGSWVNLGAGTSNSNLKNTYGKIGMSYHGHERVATEMQFMGCVVGDYTKTAINTSIFTGKIIGVCSMLYGYITRNVPGFVNYARSFGQVSEVPPRIMAAIQGRAFARRGVEQRPCDVALIESVFELTRGERDALEDTLTDDPLAI